VVAAEVLLVLPRKSACPRQIPEFAGLDQQAAGKDVGLDEIGVAGIALEQVVAHGDELDRGPAARLEIARKAIEEHRPVFAAERLDHFDADDAVEMASGLASSRVAIVLLAELDARVLSARP